MDIIILIGLNWDQHRFSRNNNKHFEQKKKKKVLEKTKYQRILSLTKQKMKFDDSPKVSVFGDD